MIDVIAKTLFGLGLIFIIVKGIGKRPSGTYNKLYILHKAGAGLATILAFVHGFTIEPQNQAYVLTGWFLGLTLLPLFILGVFLGFQNGWVPFDEEKNRKYRNLRIVKWVLTVLVIAAFASHYLFSN
ncbi:MAG: hypothetical protein ACFFEU_04850 [Candidatus Thorarchaeota archaeon]